jgi:hypothetical protein
MVKELEGIDTSSFRALAEIRQDELALQGLVEKANAQKDQVTEAVYERVTRDYTGRLRALELRARPLRDTARAELAKLHAVRDRLKVARDTAEMDHQELEFRMKLGELRPEDFEARQKTLADGLSAAQSDFDEVERVCRQFAEVVPLEPPRAGAEEKAVAAAPPPPPSSATMQAPPADFEDDEERGTIMVPRSAVPPPQGASREFATIAVSLARLVQEADGKPAVTHELGTVTNIGRIPENQIELDKPEVSRNHARIAMTETGWLLTDLNSGNGTYVNDERVKERRLKNGDRIRIGTTHFVFEGK